MMIYLYCSNVVSKSRKQQYAAHACSERHLVKFQRNKHSCQNVRNIEYRYVIGNK